MNSLLEGGDFLIADIELSSSLLEENSNKIHR